MKVRNAKFGIFLDAGNAISTGKELQNCLSQFFNFKMDSFAKEQKLMCSIHAANYRVEKPAKVLSCE
jgi:hypothetical protein